MVCSFTCGIKSGRGLLQLCIGQRLLVMQKTGIEEGTGPTALIQSCSLCYGLQDTVRKTLKKQ